MTEGTPSPAAEPGPTEPTEATESAGLETDRRPPRERGVRVVDAPLAPPSANQGLLEVFRRRYLLRILVRREIQARYQGSLLGFLWSYINPLTQFFIYWFVMGYIIQLHGDIQNFAIHIFSALIIVHFFTETFGSGTRSIVRNKGLVQKMAMPREMFPVAAMLVSLWHVIPQMVILLIAGLFFFDWEPSWAGLGFAALALTMLMVLGTAFALVFSVANVYFRDFGSAINIALHFVRFSVPMIYSFQIALSRFGDYIGIYLANPLAVATLLWQRAFWLPTTDPCTPESVPTIPATCTDMATAMPDGLLQRGLIMLACSVLFLVIAQVIFTKTEQKIPERL